MNAAKSNAADIEGLIKHHLMNIAHDDEAIVTDIDIDPLTDVEQNGDKFTISAVKLVYDGMIQTPEYDLEFTLTEK